MRDEILALLEDGAKSAGQLADWLEQPRMAVTRTLAAMAADGQVKTVGTAKYWALASYRPKRGRTPAAQAGRKTLLAQLRPPAKPVIARPAVRQAPLDPVDRLLLIEEPPALGDCVCERCGNRFWRQNGTAGRFCSRRCYETPAPPQTRTIVADGVEFDAVSVGKLPLTHWPDDGPRGGSSLSGGTFGVRR